MFLTRNRVLAAALVALGWAGVAPAQTPAPAKDASATSVKDQQRHGMDLLKIAEVDASGLKGGMRVWVLVQIARGYAPSDKAKALELLQSALAETRTLEEEPQSVKTPAVALALVTGRALGTRAVLQDQIVQAMVPVSPERVSELLEQFGPQGRERGLTLLLSWYEENNQTDKALETIYRLSAEAEMPYAAASRMMERLKPEQSGEFQQLFVASLASYRNHAPHSSPMTAQGDFPAMVARYWQRLPGETVRDAIDEILKQADPAAQKGDINVNSFSSVSAKGANSFGSLYEYRLFQLLPVLEHIDKPAAERYLENYRSVAAMLQRFPDGENSLPKEKESIPSVSLALTGNRVAQAPELPKAQELVGMAAAGHPGEAIDKVNGIQDPYMRVRSWQGIAQTALERDPASAARAIAKMLDGAENLDPRERVACYRFAAASYLKLGDKDSARKAIEQGFTAAKKLYEKDADPENPNRALKAYWPTTDAYCGLLRVAGRVSTAWARTLLKDIPDPEVKVAAESALAGEWLGVPASQSFVMIVDKSGARMATGAE